MTIKKFFTAPSNTKESGNSKKNRRLFPYLVLGAVSASSIFLYKVFLRPEWPVEVRRTIAFPAEEVDPAESDASLGDQRGKLLFLASGWIEPDPFPIKVTSLYSGVIDRVHVLEGERVLEDQVIASLIDEDARFALLDAEAKLAESKAQEAIIEAEVLLAQASVEKALAKASQDKTLLMESNDTLGRLRSLPDGAVSKQNLFQAELAFQKHEASLLSSDSEVLERRAHVRLLTEKLSAQSKTSKVYEINRDKASLDLNRTQVRSPKDGIILRLLARPGKRLMLHMDDPDAGSAAILYEEGKLQARIDVPLGEASKIRQDQIVEISSGIFPEKVFLGKVSRILGEADLQRNTLQVKVRLLNPDPRLRPEMLCRAKFFAKSDDKVITDSNLLVFIDKSLISPLPEIQQSVWVVSREGNRAEMRKITIGELTKDELIEIRNGLFPGDLLIVDPPAGLQEGDRIKIKGKS